MTKAIYTADNMQQLDPLDAIRRRPGVYIGGTNSAALMHLLWEALDNAVDEHLVGYGNKIIISLNADGSFQVDDYARGIPTGVNKKTGKTGVQMAFGLHSGGKFNQNAYAISGGLNGVGIAALAALSTRTTATVYQNKKQHVLEFRQGKEGIFQGPEETAPFTPKEGLVVSPDKRTAAEKKERPTGTSIKWYPDYEVFDTEETESGKATLDLEQVLRRAKNTCYLLPGLSIEVHDYRSDNHETYSYHFPNGFHDMLKDMSTTELVNEPLIFSDDTSFTTKNIEKKMYVDIAIQWEKSVDTHQNSFVNIIQTSLGGTHVNGALKGIEESIVEIIQSRSLLKAKDPMPELIDISEGLNLIVSVKLPEPGYSSQTKERLTESSVNGATKRIVQEHLKQWLNSRKSSAEVKEVLEKIINAAKVRKARNAQFDVSDVLADISKQPIFSRKPENLKECQMVSDPRSELMIVEGASALGTLYKARSAKYQALFPLKGKPQNVYGLSPERLFIPPAIKSPKTPAEKRKDSQRKKFLEAGHILLQNKELDDLVKIIGAGFGESFALEEMRYHRVMLVADADVDGGHIEALLIGFFATYMPQIIEHGRLYLACPPLFVVKAGKESNPEILLASNDRELEKLLAECKKQKKKIIHVARRKGHGESSKEEVFEYIMNPSTRKVKQITIEDVQDAQRMLELTLGNDAAPRKEWITDPRTRELVNVEDLS